jgi:hypothetical protein
MALRIRQEAEKQINIWESDRDEKVNAEFARRLRDERLRNDETMAYFVQYIEQTVGGMKRLVEYASLEDAVPAIILPEEKEIASRKWISSEPLYLHSATLVADEPVATLRLTELLREAANALESCHAANVDLLAKGLRPAPKVPEVGPVWIDGAPSGFRAEEWFIALTTDGDRVVLIALPEEYTYDFKTADYTYIMRDNIKKWMPFPDSEYKYPVPKVPEGYLSIPINRYKEICDCLEAMATGRGGWAWEDVLDEHRAMLAAAPKGEE